MYVGPILSRQVTQETDTSILRVRYSYVQNRQGIYYENIVIYSAANFCFNKGLCMIWNKGTSGKDKSC